MVELNLAEHAEAWMQETGRIIPAWGTEAWNKAYDEWIEYAFEGFKGGN